MRCHWFATGILALVVLSADGTLIARGTTRVDVGAADGRRDTGLPGIPDSQADVGGWEDYPPIHRPRDWDTDHDGLPDPWEARRGLDPKDPRDGMADPDGDGYTNLEGYLNKPVAGLNVTAGEQKSRRR